MTTAGDAEAQSGMAAHVLIVTKSMEREHFFNADGEMLIVAQENKLRFRTEFGVIEIEPGEICVIPRGVIFRVELINGPARGYVCENYGGAFKLPDRGPIGANCLANARDFLCPEAAYEDVEKPCTLYVKWGGELFRTKVPHSPLDVVGVARQLLSVQIRPAAVLAGRRAAVRSSRSVDLHGDDLAVGDRRAPPTSTS